MQLILPSKFRIHPSSTSVWLLSQHKRWSMYVQFYWMGLVIISMSRSEGYTTKWNKQGSIPVGSISLHNHISWYSDIHCHTKHTVKVLNNIIAIRSFVKSVHTLWELSIVFRVSLVRFSWRNCRQNCKANKILLVKWSIQDMHSQTLLPHVMAFFLLSHAWLPSYSLVFK